MLKERTRSKPPEVKEPGHKYQSLDVQPRLITIELTEELRTSAITADPISLSAFGERPQPPVLELDKIIHGDCLNVAKTFH